MTSKTVKALGVGCARGVVLQLAVAVLMFAVLGGVMLVVATIPVSRAVERQYIFLGAFTLAIFGIVAATTGWAWVKLRQRARRLDAAFAPLGIAGRQYLTNGRQFHGSYSGRRVDAYFYRGPTFEVYLSTPLQTRLGVSPADGVARAVAGLFGKEPLALADPDLQPITVHALDEDWARNLLAEPEARRLLLRLTGTDAPDRGGYEFRQVILQPEALLLRLNHTRTSAITAENVQSWLRDLQRLLHVAEQIPPPRVSATASALERNAQTNRAAFTGPAVLIVLALIGFSAVCALVPAVLFIFLESR